jgi:hypothetical protein
MWVHDAFCLQLLFASNIGNLAMLLAMRLASRVSDVAIPASRQRGHTVAKGGTQSSNKTCKAQVREATGENFE